MGAGNPVATQYRNNLVPTLTVYVGPGGFKFTLGGSMVVYIHKQVYHNHGHT